MQSLNNASCNYCINPLNEPVVREEEKKKRRAVCLQFFLTYICISHWIVTAAVQMTHRGGILCF